MNPTQPSSVRELLEELIQSKEGEEILGETRVEGFQEAGLLTRDEGVILTFKNGETFYLRIAK